VRRTAGTEGPAARWRGRACTGAWCPATTAAAQQRAGLRQRRDPRRAGAAGPAPVRDAARRQQQHLLPVAEAWLGRGLGQPVPGRLARGARARRACRLPPRGLRRRRNCARQRRLRRLLSRCGGAPPRRLARPLRFFQCGGWRRRRQSRWQGWGGCARSLAWPQRLLLRLRMPRRTGCPTSGLCSSFENVCTARPCLYLLRSTLLLLQYRLAVLQCRPALCHTCRTAQITLTQDL